MAVYCTIILFIAQTTLPFKNGVYSEKEAYVVL